MLSAVELSTTRVGFRGEAVGAAVRKSVSNSKPYNIQKL